jgi:hypothetical protein
MLTVLFSKFEILKFKMLAVIFSKFKILKFKMVAVIFSKHEFFLKKFENQNLKYWRFFSKFEFEFTFKKLNF